MYKKADLIKTPEYWLENIQDELFRLIKEYMGKKRINRTQLAKEWGVSKGYISQILNGNFNFSLTKFIELILSIEKIPVIKFINTDEYLNKIENIEQSKKSFFVKYENCRYVTVHCDTEIYSPSVENFDTNQKTEKVSDMHFLKKYKRLKELTTRIKTLHSASFEIFSTNDNALNKQSKSVLSE